MCRAVHRGYRRRLSGHFPSTFRKLQSNKKFAGYRNPRRLFRPAGSYYYAGEADITAPICEAEWRRIKFLAPNYGRTLFKPDKMHLGKQRTNSRFLSPFTILPWKFTRRHCKRVKRVKQSISGLRLPRRLHLLAMTVINRKLCN